MSSKLKKAILVIPLILVVLVFVATSCMTFRQSNKKTLAFFESKNQVANIDVVEFESKEVRYVESGFGTNKDVLIVFVHGAPGSSKDLLPFLADSTLLLYARMITVDRLGYGYSDYGTAVTSISQQAEMINAIIENAPESKIILVGHSYGGPIIAKAAALNPKIDALLMLAPVNDPYNEKSFWVSNLAKWKLTKWMFSKAWQVAAAEKFSHEEELLKMKSDWNNLAIPVVHIHGHKDFLAPPSNVQWSQDNIKNEYLKIIDREDLDHFIPFTNKQLVVEELELLMKSFRY